LLSPGIPAAGFCKDSFIEALSCYCATCWGRDFDFGSPTGHKLYLVCLRRATYRSLISFWSNKPPPASSTFAETEGSGDVSEQKKTKATENRDETLGLTSCRGCTPLPPGARIRENPSLPLLPSVEPFPSFCYLMVMALSAKPGRLSSGRSFACPQ
jgi:hypothetical protein